MDSSNTTPDIIRDFISNLGYFKGDCYFVGENCLNTLEGLEKELLAEDVVKRDVRIYLGNCDVVKNDLLPIIIHNKDYEIQTAAVRLLANLTLPTEFLVSLENDEVSSQIQIVRKSLHEFTFSTKKAFLDSDSTLSVVTMLRESIIKSEKYQYPLKEEDCIHLKNCILLLRNILYFPDEADIFVKNFEGSCLNFSQDIEWQSLQNKLIWNLFLQGLGGALLLMCNSRHKEHWTVPLASIIALLYRNQNIYKVNQVLKLVSSSESSGDDEAASEESKHSSTSLSSEPAKISDRLSDSGCPQSSDAYSVSTENKLLQFCTHSNSDIASDFSSDIHKKFEAVRISDDINIISNPNMNYCKSVSSNKTKSRHHRDIEYDEVFIGMESENSSCSETPLRKKVKGNCCSIESTNSESDSVISEISSSEFMQGDPHDIIFKDKKHVKNHKVNQKFRCTNANSIFESDSSNEDNQNRKYKFRSHPPTCRRGKSPRRHSGCNPHICLEAAFSVSCTNNRIRYPLWEKKRNSISKLVDINSPTPTDDDISNLLKEFTLGFMHSGYSKLIVDVKLLLFEEQHLNIDKSLFFWLVLYFLHLASTLNLAFDHLNALLTVDFVSYLVYESVIAYENVQLNCNENENITKRALRHLNLSVTALKEVITAIDLYSRKPSFKDKSFLMDLCGKLAELQDLRQLPILLLQNYHPSTHSKKYLEDVIILNHQILLLAERGSEYCWFPKQINISAHLKQFASQSIINSYSKVLDDYKSNSQILNDCVFTFMHHVAGDIHASELLIQPVILKTFSGILQEDIVLEQYQEDLIMYVLNRFSQQVKKRNLKRSPNASNDCSEESDDTSSTSSSNISNSCLLLDEDDDLFWWYLQFEQDKDPVTKISEHTLLSKHYILQKLQLKGIISQELYRKLEDKMDENKDNLNNSEESLIHITNFDDDITHLLRTLVQSGHRQHLLWLQDILLETCYAKLDLYTHVVEPISYNSIKMKSSIPIVPYTEEQNSILKDKIFLQLLKRLGFHLSSINSLTYPRIPIIWSPSLLFTVAARLGPVKKDKLKFTYEDLMFENPNHYTIENICVDSPSISSCNTLSCD